MNLKFQHALREISARHVQEAVAAAMEGYKRDGRGVVMIELDVDTKECKILWTPLARIVNENIRQLALKYNPDCEFVAVGKPMGRFEGQGYMTQTLPILQEF